MEVQDLRVDVQWGQRLWQGQQNLSRTGQEPGAPQRRLGTGGQRRVLTPDVMMTDWKRSNTGLMASEASMQLWEQTRVVRARPWGLGGPWSGHAPTGVGSHLKCRIGLAMVGVLSSKGSMMMVKPTGGQ